MRGLCLFVFIVMCLCFARAQPMNGLQARFSFESSGFNDDVGANLGKAVGASLVKDRFNNPASACYLHGNYGSYLNLGTGSSLKPVIGSISLWFKLENVKRNGKGLEYNPIILARSSSGEDFIEGYYAGYDYNSKKLNVNMSLDEERQVTINSADTISLGEWHHVVLAYDDEYLSFYLDNVLENKMPKGFRSFFTPGDSVLLGNTHNPKNLRFYCGAVDDIHIYNRVISAKEVSELYNMPDPDASGSYYKLLLQLLIALLLITLIAIYFVRRYKKQLDKEKEKHLLNAKMNELETKAIRMQMNPHFIFNSLNSFQSFILEENYASALYYLERFSILVRKFLESSISDSISISEEVEILRNYIELEKIRFEDTFAYEINCTVRSAGQSFIPFMLVQPFVENAIWHGLLPKEGDRRMSISFSDFDEGRILCVVDDNGVGRQQKAGETKKRSLALSLIQKRLELLSKTIGQLCSLEISDKKNANGEPLGTTIEIIIPKIN